MSEEEQKSSYSNDEQATVRLTEAPPEWAELQAGKRLRLSTDLVSPHALRRSHSTVH